LAENRRDTFINDHFDLSYQGRPGKIILGEYRKMFRSSKSMLGLILALIFVGLVACQGGDSELKIGQINAYSGSLSFFGESHGNSAKLAADQVMAAGGPTIVLTHEDTQVNPDVGVEAARKLVEIDNVAAIVGALSSGVSMAVSSAVTTPNEVLQISAASTSPGLTALNDNDFLFRTTVSDAAQGVVLARLAKELGYTTAASLYLNNPYGEGLAGQFKATFEADGGTVTAQVPHED